MGGGIRFRSISKYKQIVKNIYPATLDGDIQIHNIAKLIHFCEITPQKIIKISKYLESRANKDLLRNRIPFVGIAMKIYQELIFKCRKHLGLFAGNVLNFIRTSLEGSYPELIILATETFIEYAKVLDESAQCHELDVLVGHFFTMCQTDQSSPMSVKLREEGLRGIRAYMAVLVMTDELDAFVTRHTDPKNSPRFVPIILDNMAYGVAQPSVSDNTRIESEEQNSLQSLATDVLRDVFTCANISVTSLFIAIMRFFDSKNKWTPNNFARVCFTYIYRCLKPQHEQILMTLFLQHLEQNIPANVKTQIVTILVEFFRESTGHFIQVLDSLTRLLVASVEVVSQDQRARDYEDHLELQETIINCVDVLCKKIASHHQLVEAFNFLCGKLSQSKHIKPTGLSGAALAIVRCILKITSHLNSEGFNADWITLTSLNLLKDLAIHPHHEIRMIVHKICQRIVMGKANQPHLAARSVTVDERLILMIGEVARDTMIDQVKIKNSQPENFAIMYETAYMLLHFGSKREFFLGFPVIFALQKTAAKWKKIPQICASTLNTIIASYLYTAASLFDCPPLTLYVDQIMEKRKQAGHICNSIEIIKSPYPGIKLVKEKYTEEIKRKVPVDYILFDKDFVIGLMIDTPSCMLRDEPRLRRVLGKKIHRMTRGTIALKDGTIEPSESVVSETDSSFIDTSTTTSPIISHNVSNNNNDGNSNNSKSTLNILGDSVIIVEGTEGSPSITFMPSSPNSKPKAVRKLRFSDFKDPSMLVPSNSVASLNFLYKKTYDHVANNCLQLEDENKSKFGTLSKLWDFNFENMGRGDSESQGMTVGVGIDIRVTVGNEQMDDKVVYSPPSCTLDLDFNANGFFLVV